MEREVDAPTFEPDARFAWRLVAGSVGLVGLAVLWAHRVGAGGDTILGGLGPAIEGAIALGRGLLLTGGGLLAAVRAPLLLLALVWQVLQVRRRAAEPPGRRLLGALVLAAVAHSYCIDGQLAVGFAGLGFALVSLVVAREPVGVALRDDGSGPGVALFLAALAGYAVLCIYRLDVFPAVYADETAYHEAARMHLGQIAPGGSPFWDWKDYTFARFQAQFVPLLLQSAAVAGLSPGLLSIRLASFATLASAWVLAVLAIRRRLGARVAWWMLALAAGSPLALVYGRTGFYVAASILHSVAVFAALLRFVERRDRGSGLVLGVLLGGSLYFYQLSWFVPVLAGLAWLACAIGSAGGLRVVPLGPLLFAGLGAALAIAPAPLLLRDGFADVAAQTFDHRSTLRSGHAELLRPRVVVRAREEIGLQGFADIQARLAPHRAKARVVVHEGGVTTLRISGPRDRIQGALAALPGGPWRVLTDTLGAFTAPRYVARMFARLFYAPGSELGAWIPVPLLNPLVAPLVLLGFASAWRRRGEPSVRAVGVWIVGGALIPAAVGGDAARRAALILPFVFVFAAFPLVELGAWCRTGGAWSRRAGASAAALFLALVVGAGGYHYFRPVHAHWDATGAPLLRPPAQPSMLELVKAIRAVPAEVPILLHTVEPGLFGQLEAIEGWPPERASDRISAGVGARNPVRLVRLSCAQTPPFVWIFEDSEAQGALLATLEAHFEVASEVRGPYRIVHVGGPREGGCPGPG